MLRFPLAILVVFVHGFGADIDVSELHASGLTGLAVYDYIRLFFSVVIARSAVPIFFIISGYLLFLKVEEYNKTVYISKLRKRWHSLVIPYFSWIVLLILWTLMFKVGGILLHGKPWTGILDYFQNNGYLHMLWDSSVWEARTTWLGIETHNSGPVLLPFWYMRDLIIMVVISPAIYWLIKKIKFVFIILLLAIYTFDIKCSLISGTLACASLFFSIGAYFALKKLDFTEALWKWRHLICPVALLYALHPFILGYVISAFNKISILGDRIFPMSDSWYMMTFNYLASPIVCILLCIAIYCFLQKYLPSFLGVIVGERKK